MRSRALWSRDRELGMAGLLQNWRFVAQYLLSRKWKSNVAWQEYFAWVKRSRWILGGDRWNKKLLKKLRGVIYRDNHQWAKAAPVGLETSRIWPEKWRRRPFDLSIVIVARDFRRTVLELLKVFAKSLQTTMKGYEVIVIDHALATRTWEKGSDAEMQMRIGRIVRKHPSFHYLLQKKRTASGKARNIALPLLEGKYAIFLEPRDGLSIALGALLASIQE